MGPLEVGVAPGFSGRSMSLDVARQDSPFRLWTIGSLGAPHDVRVRDDVTGGMVTLVYQRERWTLLTQWRTTDVTARLAVVPGAGRAETATVARAPGMWVAGDARGTFTLVGADGSVHRESFEIGSGALLWQRAGMTFLLQGVGSRTEAIALAADVEP